MTTRMMHPKRAARVRPRRLDTASTASPASPDDSGGSLAEAVRIARQARIAAERALRRSEIERDRAGRALELTLPPRIDETERTRLRAVHSDAAAAVREARAAVDRARAVEDAATAIRDNADDDGSRLSQDLARSLLRFLESRRAAGAGADSTSAPLSARST
ncbi:MULTISPECIES: hypothetical protein [unclassified Microbacterium]|uniref:hypothetical protein n=1 Tax=unclassified Microbacterium TaxID=2609290 RepID=UPI00214CE5FF|nr:MULTISPECIES: hypothetical protein [unclassified Microbacterium]MCR2808861.1 hypothetical protein [Microbacterium sp. zg.B185]WIM18720.1 hypothetical protein QNO12_14170 [Microbacterium sp. zg-B185]